MPSATEILPRWLGRSYDFANARFVFGDYADRPNGPGGPFVSRQDDSTARACFLHAVLPTDWLPRCNETQPGPQARDLRLAMALLLDDAREAAHQAFPEAMARSRFVRPEKPPRARDIRRAWQVVECYGSQRKTLDLFLRLEPLALPPIPTPLGPARENQRPSQEAGPLHPGQGAVLARAFAQLGAGAIVDLGRNNLQAETFAWVPLQALHLAHALNLSNNSITPPVVTQLLAVPFAQLTHLSMRQALLVDDAALRRLVQGLEQLPHLRSLEVGWAGRPRSADLAFAPHGPLHWAEPLLGLCHPGLTQLYLQFPETSRLSLAALTFQGLPALRLFGLDVAPRNLLQVKSWHPHVPEPLTLLWFARTPSTATKKLLRVLFNDRAHNDGASFQERQDEMWPGFFDRSTLQPHSLFSLRRARAPT